MSDLKGNGKAERLDVNWMSIWVIFQFLFYPYSEERAGPWIINEDKRLPERILVSFTDTWTIRRVIGQQEADEERRLLT